MNKQKINEEFRSIIGHALLGYEDKISKEDWDLVFAECTKFAVTLAKGKCKQQRSICAIEIQKINPKILNHPSDLSDAMISCKEPKFK